LLKKMFLLDRQAALANPGSLNHNNGVWQFAFNRFKHFRHRPNHFRFALTTRTKKYQARTIRLGLSEQAGEIEVGRDGHTLFPAGLFQNRFVRFKSEPYSGGMNRVVAPYQQPVRPSRRRGHVDEEFNFVSSTVSSSASHAA
jgi:hypothetical protein